MNEELIERALEIVRERLSKSEQERAELDRAITAAREEERLLLRLLALRKGAEPAEGGATTAAYVGSATGMENPHETDDIANSKHPAVQAVIRELATAGRSLHISELMRLLHDKHVPIPGAGTQANLITHLRRDPRLVRPSRGMYALAAWGLENMPATVRRKKRKRRVRSSIARERSKQ